MHCALSIIVHCIEYLAWMSDLSELIDILDDDGILHSTDSTAGVGSKTVGGVSLVVSSCWFPSTCLFIVIC